MIRKMATKINGTTISKQIREELTQKVSRNSGNGIPGLAVILVGNRTDSTTYVRMKERAAKEVGINFFLERFDENVEEKTVISSIEEYNKNEGVHGIIVQLPLPRHLDEKKVCRTVLLDKDVDGLRSENIGRLAVSGENPTSIACTPKGCIELLKRSGVQIDGKNVTIVGRSNIVGLPVALLLLKENATISVCHRHTPMEELIKKLRDSDIVVVAVGKPQFIKGEWLKKGATVIDVGINSIPDSTRSRGYRLVGDVDYASAIECLGENGKITPVPGGVGPMTVAMLLLNTYERFVDTSEYTSTQKNIDTNLNKIKNHTRNWAGLY